MGWACPVVGRWGHDGVDFGNSVASRAAVVFALPSGQWMVVSWQSGYAGPPGSETLVVFVSRCSKRVPA